MENRTMINTSEETRKKIKIQAAKEGIKMSELIEKMIDQWTENDYPDINEK